MFLKKVCVLLIITSTIRIKCMEYTLILNKFVGVCKQPIAGDFLSEQLLQQLQQRFDEIVPYYLIAKKTSVEPDQPANYVPRERPNTTKSYHKYMQMVR